MENGNWKLETEDLDLVTVEPPSFQFPLSRFRSLRK